MGRKSKAKFELRGHTLPGVNQKSETSNIKDGKSPSSAFQMQSPNKHMGYEVDIKKGKVISEKEKPHSDFKTETEHEGYHNIYPSKPFTDAEGKPLK